MRCIRVLDMRGSDVWIKETLQNSAVTHVTPLTAGTYKIAEPFRLHILGNGYLSLLEKIRLALDIVRRL